MNKKQAAFEDVRKLIANYRALYEIFDELAAIGSLEQAQVEAQDKLNATRQAIKEERAAHEHRLNDMRADASRRVEEMMAAAHEQAVQTRTDADRYAAEKRAEADALIEPARAEAEKLAARTVQEHEEYQRSLIEFKAQTVAAEKARDAALAQLETVNAELRHAADKHTEMTHAIAELKAKF